jgi:monofunctional chorismate mutase
MDEIQQLRKKVDAIDDKILLALCERAKICKAIGETKKKQGVPIRDKSRETEIYRRLKEKSTQLQLNPAQIERVYREIVNMCSAVQE